MSNFEPPIMTIKGAKLSFGTNHLFTDVELYINRGDKICLVGRNGSGKSTLLKVIAGDIEADDGEIFIQPGTKISYMPQDPDFSAYKTLRDVVLSGLGEDEKHQEFKADILIEQLDIRDRQTSDSSSGGERKKPHWPRLWSENPIFCCWTSRPTIWICRRLKSWKKLSKIFAARLLSSAMTACFSAMCRKPLSGWTGELCGATTGVLNSLKNGRSNALTRKLSSRNILTKK